MAHPIGPKPLCLSPTYGSTRIPALPRFGFRYQKPENQNGLLSFLMSPTGLCGLIAVTVLGGLSFLALRMVSGKNDSTLQELNSLYQEHITPAGGDAQFTVLNDQFEAGIPGSHRLWALEQLAASQLDAKQKAIILAKGFQDNQAAVGQKAAEVTQALLQGDTLNAVRAPLETLLKSPPAHTGQGRWRLPFSPGEQVRFKAPFKAAIQTLAEQLQSPDLIVHPDIMDSDELTGPDPAGP